MADLLVKDVNGKEFSVDMNKICDINGDIGGSFSSSITDCNKNRVAKVHDTEFYDQNGNAIDYMQVLKDMENGNSNVIALDIEMEATHSGKNHNCCIYYEDSMEKDAESFVNPFKKPVLKNHDSYNGEPLGRISNSWCAPSVLTDERTAICLKARITDSESFPKFLDGRYSTVSISGTMGTVTCNICGKTILKDGKLNFCGHWKGETYKDQVCYWGAKDIEYHEVSTVNNPADDFAQIMKVTVITSDGSKTKKDNNENNKDSKKEDNTMKFDNKDSNPEDIKKTVCDMIDSLLGNTADNNNSADNKNNDSNSNNAADGSQTSGADTGDNNDSSVKDSSSSLEKELEDAKAKIESLEKELRDSKNETEKMKTNLTSVQEDATNYKDMCITLASANKSLIVDSILEKEVAGGKITAENKDARKSELEAMSTKELNALSLKNPETSDSTHQRQMANVTNPSLANPDGNATDSNGNNADTNKSTDKGARKTVDDFANDIVGKLFKNV